MHREYSSGSSSVKGKAPSLKLPVRMSVMALVSLVLMSCASLSRQGSSSMADRSPNREPVAVKKPVATTSTSATSANVVVREEKVKVVENYSNDNADYNYYVIIGSFRIIDNARNFKNQLVDEGFQPVILENENGLFRVSVASYNDETPARNRIAGIRANYQKYSDVWLLIRKR
jgi:cell division protein FtsN